MAIGGNLGGQDDLLQFKTRERHRFSVSKAISQKLTLQNTKIHNVNRSLPPEPRMTLDTQRVFNWTSGAHRRANSKINPGRDAETAGSEPHRQQLADPLPKQPCERQPLKLIGN